MAPLLSDSENIVIREIFKNPKINLEDISTILNEERKKKWEQLEQDGRLQKKVDVRSVSKFKSLALSKIRKNLEELADNFRLDRTPQDQYRYNTLLGNGVLEGHDYRINRAVYLIYMVEDRAILPWQDHTCNVKCREDCNTILNLFRSDHGLDVVTKDVTISDQFRITINEIVEKNKE
ncbi:MAG: hypothetical protein ACXAC8_03250 [Candidatus Hodarchaeales archaeon]|jgi:hypothetical protein